MLPRHPEGTTTYTYNAYRQLQSEARTFTALTGETYTLNYSYGLADQVRQVSLANWSKTINYAYNYTGALTGVGTNLTGTDPNTSTNVLNTVSYRAFGGVKSLN